MRGRAKNLFILHFLMGEIPGWIPGNILVFSPVMTRHTEGNRKEQRVPRVKKVSLSLETICVLSYGKNCVFISIDLTALLPLSPHS